MNDVTLIATMLIMLSVGIVIGLVIRHYELSTKLHACVVILHRCQQHSNLDNIKIDGVNAYFNLMNQAIDQIQFIKDTPFKIMFKKDGGLELKYKKL